MTEYTGVACDGEHKITLARNETYVHVEYAVKIRNLDGSIRRTPGTAEDFCMTCWNAFLQQWVENPGWLVDVQIELRSWRFPACQHRPNVAVDWDTPCLECL